MTGGAHLTLCESSSPSSEAQPGFLSVPSPTPTRGLRSAHRLRLRYRVSSRSTWLIF
ncbi:hypothetical protein RSAG8_09412, partial [Rhizoctonia solani AG-8 WAC10335]